MKLTPKRRELIAAIRAYAIENYNTGGWDVIVECYDDAAIASVTGKARTLKGALARFATILDVVTDRRAAAESEITAAVGTPATGAGTAHYAVFSSSLAPYDGMLDCSCGAEFFTEKLLDLHVAERNQALGCYDNTAQGHHPDGSFVAWRHDEHSGDAWATRTWEGKLGRGCIDIRQDETGDYVTVESYVPGWRGADLVSPNFCDYDAAVPF